MEVVLFAIAGVFSLAGALGVVAARKPVHSALSLLVVLGSLAVLYLTLSAQFVAALQVILYAGAIVVLFLFVIMLVLPRVSAAAPPSEAGTLRTVALVFGATLAVLLGMGAARGMQGLAVKTPPENFGSVEAVGRSLFTEFVLPFEIAAIILLVGLMTAVVLGKAPERP
jgi:NADH-quinone oxidoreductase subunit J